MTILNIILFIMNAKILKIVIVSFFIMIVLKCDKTMKSNASNTEHFGHFMFDNMKVSAGIRFGNDGSKGGFNLCLKLYNDASNDWKNMYTFFGDDKFEIKEYNFIDKNEIKVVLTYDLHKHCDFFSNGIKEFTFYLKID